jgi:hypothetical protein
VRDVLNWAEMTNYPSRTRLDPRTVGFRIIQVHLRRYLSHKQKILTAPLETRSLPVGLTSSNGTISRQFCSTPAMVLTPHSDWWGSQRWTRCAINGLS